MVNNSNIVVLFCTHVEHTVIKCEIFSDSLCITYCFLLGDVKDVRSIVVLFCTLATIHLILQLSFWFS